MPGLLPVLATLTTLAMTGATLSATCPDTTREIARQFQLVGNQSVLVQHSFGDLQVLPAPAETSPRLLLKLTASGDRQDLEADFLQRVDLAVEPPAQQGGPLLVRSVFPPPEEKPENLSFHAALTLWLPAGAPLELVNRYGAVDVLDHQAPLKIENRLGPVRVRRQRGDLEVSNHFDQVVAVGIQGKVTVIGASMEVQAEGVTGDLTVRNSFGEVRATRVTGLVDVENRNQPIVLTDISGPVRLVAPHCAVTVMNTKDEVRIESSNAKVILEDIGGMVEVRHKYGDVEIRRAAGPTTVFGNLTPVLLENCKGTTEIRCTASSVRVIGLEGSLDLQTTSGAVEVRGVSGDVIARTRSGLMRIAIAPPAAGTPMTGTYTLENHLSPIEIELMPELSCTLEAQSVGRTVDSEFPNTVVEKAGNLTLGTLRLGTGDLAVHAIAVDGTIRISKGTK